MKFKTMRWQEIVSRLPKDLKIDVLEIGSWQGRTSEYLLSNLPLLKLTMIDPYCDPIEIPSFRSSGAKMAKYSAEIYEQAYQNILKLIERYPDRAVIIREQSVIAEKRFNPERKFDLILIDGDHSYEGVSTDSNIWAPHIKSGGLLVFHDYGRGFKGVKKAVDERFRPEEIELGDDTTAFIRIK